jgi:hypothetical protein
LRPAVDRALHGVLEYTRTHLIYLDYDLAAGRK